MKINILIVLLLFLSIILSQNPRVSAQEIEETEPLEAESVASFEIYVDNLNPVAGEEFWVNVVAMDKYGNVVSSYTGEGFEIGGGDEAPDGTQAEYEPEGEWEEGARWYWVRFYGAGGPQRIEARAGEAGGQSGEVWVGAGVEDRIEVVGGDGQSGPVGKDVTEVSGRDLEVVVYDGWGNPVEGVGVEFRDATNGSWVDVDEGVEGIQEVVLTGEGGRAVCEVWVLGERYGENRVEAWIPRGSVQRAVFSGRPEWTSRNNLGLIYNIDLADTDFIPNPESYQGGIGVKYYILKKLAYRGLLNIIRMGNEGSISLTLGNAAEYHFLNGRVSPYIGGLLDIGYMKVRSEVDSDNWTENVMSSVTFGPVIGTEIFILSFLSLFVEYEFVFERAKNTTRTSVAGVVTEDSSKGVDIQTGFGNESMIGITLYLNRIGKKWRADKKRNN